MSKYFNKNELMSIVMSDMAKNNHIKCEAFAIHKQEHNHLLSVLDNSPTYSALPVTHVKEILTQLFSDIEGMMETQYFHDVTCGDWEETYAEIHKETLELLRKKYFDLIDNA